MSVKLNSLFQGSRNQQWPPCGRPEKTWVSRNDLNFREFDMLIGFNLVHDSNEKHKVNIIIYVQWDYQHS